jgi:hypothetical protein
VLVAEPIAIKLDEAETLRRKKMVNPLRFLICDPRYLFTHGSTICLNSVNDGGGLVQEKRMCWARGVLEESATGGHQ